MDWEKMKQFLSDKRQSLSVSIRGPFVTQLPDPLPWRPYAGHEHWQKGYYLLWFDAGEGWEAHPELVYWNGISLKSFAIYSALNEGTRPLRWTAVRG